MCLKYPVQRARGPRGPHTVTPFERGMITQVLCEKSCNFIIALKSYRLTLRTLKVSLVIRPGKFYYLF